MFVQESAFPLPIILEQRGRVSQQLLSLSFAADTLPAPPPPPRQQHQDQTDSPQKRPASPSKPPKSQRPSEGTGHYPQDVQSDQLQRAAVLGPPGSPLRGGSVSEDQRDRRLEKLERRVEEMATMLDMVKAQVRLSWE